MGRYKYQRNEAEYVSRFYPHTIEVGDTIDLIGGHIAILKKAYWSAPSREELWDSFAKLVTDGLARQRKDVKTRQSALKS